MPGTLQELDAYLQSEGSPADSMMLSDLDGFLTGISCTPTPVANWADVAFGAGAHVPPRVMKLMRNRLDHITTSLSANPSMLEPVFWRAPEGHTIAMDWCEGFIEAVKLNSACWDRFAQSSKGAKLMLPILIHMFDDDGNSLFGLRQEDIDQTLAAASQAIPQVVPQIYREIRMLG